MTLGGARGQNLGQHQSRYFFFAIVCFMESFAVQQRILFSAVFLSLTSDLKVRCPRVGLEVKCRTSLIFVSHEIIHT